MKNRLLRTGALVLTCLLLVCMLPACGKNEAPPANGIAAVRLNEKEQVCIEATADAATQSAYAGQKAYLYECLPGQPSIMGKAPIAEAQVDERMRFEVDLNDGARSRLSSSFAVVLEDGTWLSPAPHWIENPSLLSKHTDEFGWSSSPKGLQTADPDVAFELGAMHVMLTVRLSLIANSEGALIEESLLAEDRQVAAATASGQQVSLTVIPDLELSYPSLYQCLASLTARYNGGERGCVSALFLESAPARYDSATVCRLAYLALCSQVAHGRVFTVASARTAQEAEAEFAALGDALTQGGAMEWGAAVRLSTQDAPWLSPTDGLLGARDLSATAAAARSKGACRFALCSLLFASENPELQAASVAYAYRSAVEAGADLIYYGSDFSDTYGLFDDNGVPTRAAALFGSVDSGFSTADRALCKKVMGDAWNTSEVLFQSRTVLTGGSEIRTMGRREKPWFDFTKGEPQGFVSVSSPEAATTRHSAAYEAPVLFAWMSPARVTDSGVRCVLNDTRTLRGVGALAVDLLAQLAEAPQSNVTLSLEGYDPHGKRLSYTDTRTLESGVWQSVLFDVSPFVAAADPDAPCVLTLTVSPDVAVQDELTCRDFALWVGGIRMRHAVWELRSFLPGALALTVAAAVFLSLILIYRRSVKRR